VIVVSDTSILIYLKHIGKLYLLRELYGSICIPKAVAHELAPRPGKPSLLIDTDWVKIANAELKQALSEDLGISELDQGEREAIAIAYSRNADLLLIDEKLGRDAAQRLGIPLTGLLGVLKAAKGLGLIEAVKPLGDQAIKAGYRIDSKLYTSFLKGMDE